MFWYYDEVVEPICINTLYFPQADKDVHYCENYNKLRSHDMTHCTRLRRSVKIEFRAGRPRLVFGIAEKQQEKRNDALKYCSDACYSDRNDNGKNIFALRKAVEQNVRDKLKDSALRNEQEWCDGGGSENGPPLLRYGRCGCGRLSQPTQPRDDRPHPDLSLQVWISVASLTGKELVGDARSCCGLCNQEVERWGGSDFHGRHEADCERRQRDGLSGQAAELAERFAVVASEVPPGIGPGPQGGVGGQGGVVEAREEGADQAQGVRGRRRAVAARGARRRGQL